jgi:hypothetical protein
VPAVAEELIRFARLPLSEGDRVIR